tara:strand:- start:1918 stop:3558 length:1641 start_codon:yes stop_codon:yes gene_type:complete
VQKKLKVILCSSQRGYGEYQKNTIYLWPTKDRWNDFKFKTHGMFVVHLENSSVISGEILFAVNTSIHSVVGEFTGIGNFVELENNGDLELFQHNYFSLLPSLSSYRSIVSEAGNEFASLILTSLNDIVVFNNEKLAPKWLSKSLNSDVFNKSFMRNSEPFFAFHNASDILRGLNFEELDYVSSELDLSFQLGAFNNKHELKLRFSPSGLVPKRINILIGENGLGKSQSLNQFVRSALQQRGYADNLIDPSGKSKRPMINRVLAIGTPGETTNTYPTDSIKNPKLSYRRLILTRNSRSKSNRTIGKSIVQLARLEESISEFERWDIFIEALNKALPLEQIRITLNDYEGHLESVPLKKLKAGYNEEKLLKIWSSIADNSEPRIEVCNELHPMSSGQLSFFKFALLACLHIENGSFVLLDEPETHLHPSLISDFINLLDTILEKTGSYAIVATHSPYFVREVSREQVHIFKRLGECNIGIFNPRLKTFGANIGDISHFVFDEDIGNTLSQKIVDKAKDEEIPYSHIKNNFSKELPTEILQNIKRKMRM